MEHFAWKTSCHSRDANPYRTKSLFLISKKFFFQQKVQHSSTKIVSIPIIAFETRPFSQIHWYDSAIKPRICKVLEKNFWGGSIIKWVILYPKHRTSGCHVIGSRDNHVSKFEVPKNVGSFFWYLHWIFPDFLSIDDFSIV